MRSLAAAALFFAFVGPLMASDAPSRSDAEGSALMGGQIPSQTPSSGAGSDAAPQAAPTGDREARLTDVSGTVYVHLHDQPDGDYIAAEKGAPLEAGDLVRTGTDGHAEVTLDGESVIDVAANTDFVVNSLAREQTEFHVGIGSIAAKIKTLLFGESMSFQTSTAVAAVRGTELAVAQDGDDQPARVGVFDEGHVSVTSPQGSGEVQLGPGQETEVAQGGRMAPPRALSSFAGERDRMAAIRQRQAFQRQHWRARSRQQRLERRMAMRRRNVFHAQQLRNVREDMRARQYGQLRSRQQMLRQRLRQQQQQRRVQQRRVQQQRRQQDQQRQRQEQQRRQRQEQRRAQLQQRRQQGQERQRQAQTRRQRRQQRQQRQLAQRQQQGRRPRQQGRP